MGKEEVLGSNPSGSVFMKSLARIGRRLRAPFAKIHQYIDGAMAEGAEHWLKQAVPKAEAREITAHIGGIRTRSILSRICSISGISDQQAARVLTDTITTTGKRRFFRLVKELGPKRTAYLVACGGREGINQIFARLSLDTVKSIMQGNDLLRFANLLSVMGAQETAELTERLGFENLYEIAAHLSEPFLDPHELRTPGMLVHAWGAGRIRAHLSFIERGLHEGRSISQILREIDSQGRETRKR
jgi:hypothetical protein